MSQWKEQYPPELRAIAADAPLLRYTSTVSWRDVAQSRRSWESQDLRWEMELRQAATAITGTFMADVAKRMAIHRTERADGVHTEFTACCLRYDQFMELLYRAYREGQSDGLKRAPQAWPAMAGTVPPEG